MNANSPKPITLRVVETSAAEWLRKSRASKPQVTEAAVTAQVTDALTVRQVTSERVEVGKPVFNYPGMFGAPDFAHIHESPATSLFDLSRVQFGVPDEDLRL